MALDVPTDASIAVYERKARVWMELLRARGHGLPEDAAYDAGMYPLASVTPYGHALVQHVPDQLRRCQRLGLPLRAFSCAPVEKKHHIQGSFFFKATARDGGTAKSSSVAAVLHLENRQLRRAANPHKQGKSKQVRLQARPRAQAASASPASPKAARLSTAKQAKVSFLASYNLNSRRSIRQIGSTVRTMLNFIVKKHTVVVRTTRSTGSPRYPCSRS